MSVQQNAFPKQLPIQSAVIPTMVFGLATYFAQTSWPAIDSTPSGYLLLSVALGLPMFSLCTPPSRSLKHQIIAICMFSFAGAFLLFHGGLSEKIVQDMDGNKYPSTHTILAFLDIFISSLSVPLSTLIVIYTPTLQKLYVYTLVPAIGAAIGQQLWFLMARLANGPSAIDLWLSARSLIHAGSGALFGLLVGAAQIYGPNTHHQTFGGTWDIVLHKLPKTLPLGAMILSGIIATAGIRVWVDHIDTQRYATKRIDEYFLALSNVRRAQVENLLYPALEEELNKSRRALLSATQFDPLLTELFAQMLFHLESQSSSRAHSHLFLNAVMKINKHLLQKQSPLFFEPHEINTEDGKTRFILRYKVENRHIYQIHGRKAVPILRLRRMDGLSVDTRLAGLSYPGLGTILMDHIDDSALHIHGKRFTSRKEILHHQTDPVEQTRTQVNQDIIRSLKTQLKKRGLSNKAAHNEMARIARQWNSTSHVGLRKQMSTEAVVLFDSIAELLAKQTEIHEARHALDEHIPHPIKELEEIKPGRAMTNANAEIRAHLTEIIEGPLGPHYGLAIIWNMVAGEHAVANAYFFASIVVLEGLWGQKIRRPSYDEVSTQNGTQFILLPIDGNNPGWLSKLKICDCYGTLRRMSSQELRRRAISLFESLYQESYMPIKRIQ